MTNYTRSLGFSAPWQRGLLGSLYKRQTAVINPRQFLSNDFQYFSIPAFDSGREPIVEKGALIESVKFIVPSQAVLISKLNPRIPRVWVPQSILSNAIASTEFVVVVPETSVNRSFLGWLMQSELVLGRMVLLASGTTKSHVRIHPSQIATIEVSWPSQEEEQTAIGSVLDDVSAEIAALETLIAKKSAIKQGMMQELLTGRTRLPGFDGAWMPNMSLGEVTDRIAGFWGAGTLSDRTPNEVGVITAGDISADGRLTGTATRYFSNGELAKAACRSDDFIVTNSGNGLGKTTYIRDGRGLAPSNFVRILRPHKGVSGEFLTHLMHTTRARSVLDAHTATSAYPNLMPSFYAAEWFDLPPYDEQRAIAEVLRDVDAEVAALERRLKTTQDIKQGMMQELLTGHTRLPINKEVTA